jgi:hypothetical protein
VDPLAALPHTTAPWLKATHSTARRMEGAGGASTRAAPSQLFQAARRIAPCMEAAGGASKTAAPSQSLMLPAACTARCVCGPHSRSPTVRRRCHPQHPTQQSHGVSRAVRRTR